MSNQNTIKLPYAIKQDGKLIHISDIAENGLKCNCICPGCKEKLVAKKGNIKIHHFAHKSNSNCQIGFQSMLHILAKEIFSEIEKFSFTKFDGKILTYNVTATLLENKINDIIPDIILNCEGKIFFVEIFVTHAINEEKKEKIKEMDISTVEYDLSKIDRNIDKEKLKNILFGNPKINWFYDADEKRIAKKQKFLFENGEKIEKKQGVIECPFAPSKIGLTLFNRNFYIYRQKVTEKFCEDCIFYSGKNEKGESFCGKSFFQSQDFDFSTLVGKNIVMTNLQTQVYINRFVQRANKMSM